MISYAFISKLVRTTNRSSILIKCACTDFVNKIAEKQCQLIRLDFFFSLHCLVVYQLAPARCSPPSEQIKVATLSGSPRPGRPRRHYDLAHPADRQMASLGQVRWGDDRYTAMLIEKVMSQTLSRWDVKPLWATGAPSHFLQCFAHALRVGRMRARSLLVSSWY